jgi:aspartyl-tRNA(Asn)/glutamyl-tRNA(Gln) amidotransferase subunit A
MSGEGVPTGVQVVGHPNDEATVFRVAQAIESVPGRLPAYPGRN